MRLPLGWLRRSSRSTREQRRSSAPVKEPAVEVAPSYRRNRTLSRPSQDSTERSRIRRLRATRRKVSMLLAATVVAGAVLAFGLSQFSGSVQLAASGGGSMVKPVDEAFYQGIFDTYYRNNPLQRFRFLTDNEALLASVRRQAPEVAAIIPAGTAGVTVSRYELQLRQPVASWVVNDSRHYVDAGGVVFGRNYFTEPTVTVVDNSGAQTAEGSAIASGRLLSFVGRAVSLASEAGLEVESIEVPPQMMRQLRLKIKNSPEVRMTIDRAVEVQVADMVAVLKHLEGGRLLDYVDVRVAGKSFYR